jgi:hypothetical protein
MSETETEARSWRRLARKQARDARRRARVAAASTWVMVCAITLGMMHQAVGIEERARDLDWYIALEGVTDSNVNLSDVSPEDDVRITAFGELSYKKATPTREFKAGVKLASHTYMDHEDLSNVEMHAFFNGSVEMSGGTLDGFVRFSDITDAVSEDLLITKYVRRLATEASVGSVNTWEKTRLSLRAAFLGADYKGAAYDGFDNTVLSVSAGIGAELSEMTTLSLVYGFKSGNYELDSRPDFTVNSFGLSARHNRFDAAAYEATLSWSRVSPDGGEAEDTLTGALQATWNVSPEKTMLMVALARDIIPSSVGPYSTNAKASLSLRHNFNPGVNGEIGFTYETGDYDDGMTETEVKRFGATGGMGVSLGRRTLAYLKAKWLSRAAEGGSTLEYSSTCVALGVKYGF